MFSVIETSGQEHIVKKNDTKTVSELLSFLSPKYLLSRFEEKETSLQEIFTKIVMERLENGGTFHESNFSYHATGIQIPSLPTVVLADDRSIAVIIRRRVLFFQNKRFGKLQ